MNYFLRSRFIKRRNDRKSNPSYNAPVDERLRSDCGSGQPCRTMYAGIEHVVRTLRTVGESKDEHLGVIDGRMKSYGKPPVRRRVKAKQSHGCSRQDSEGASIHESPLRW